jgi:hypothetical protein
MCATGVRLCVEVSPGLSFDVAGYLKQLGCTCEPASLRCSARFGEEPEGVAFWCPSCGMGALIHAASFTSTPFSPEGQS